MAKILLLGGTTEARALAARLAPDHNVVTSFAGRTAVPKNIAGTVRVGGFGGSRGLADYLKAEGIDLLIDATHPFAARISANARAACDASETPRLILRRPPWNPVGADIQRAATVEHAALLLPALGKRAFLTVGRDSLAPFRDVKGVWMLARYLEAPAEPRPFHIIVGRPPFAEETERRLLRDHGITVLVAKDAGGAATEAKITAAVKEGVRILMIDRPKPEPGTGVESVDAAVDWVRRFSA